jgi:DNA-binding response OmpR family regulator
MAMKGCALKILLVDDDEPIREEIADYLTRRQLDVSTSESFSAAQRALAEVGDDLDVLITDVRLPDGSGLDLVEQISAALGPRPRIIVITGHLDQKASAQARESGAEAVMLKPFKLRALFERIVSIDALSAPAGH